MKRLFLAVLFLSFFDFSPALAYDPPYPLPYTYNGITYINYIEFETSNCGIVQVYYTGTYNPTYMAGFSYIAPYVDSSGYKIGKSSCWGTNWIDLGIYGLGMPFNNNWSTVHSSQDIVDNPSALYNYCGENNSNNCDLRQTADISLEKVLNITRSPELGGGVTVTVPPGFPEYQCGIDSEEECEFEVTYNAQVTLEASANDGYEFSHWEINSQTMGDTDGTIDISMSEDKVVVAVFYLKADDFVFPVLAQGVTDPLLNNTLNPDGNGWHGADVGELALHEGHLGQDYSVDSGSSAGKPVYAVANGTIVEIMNDPTHTYGWRCDDGDHGWGPVVVIRHENRDGFNTSGSIVTGSCDTEINPTVIYSLYGHLSKTSIQNLQVGQTVTKGQQLGVLGTSGVDWSSGISMASHLHFELKDEVGFLEGSWYVTHPGECPQETSQNCDAEGIGRGYSHSYGFAPHRYDPEAFVNANKQ